MGEALESVVRTDCESSLSCGVLWSRVIDVERLVVVGGLRVDDDGDVFTLLGNGEAQQRHNQPCQKRRVATFDCDDTTITCTTTTQPFEHTTSTAVTKSAKVELNDLMSAFPAYSWLDYYFTLVFFVFVLVAFNAPWITQLTTYLL
eukprot:TRINITY_DN3586_c0_g1_i1.p1 TRINITY_DN3586_c0_g1~~TRINITY_DN3586_c0_g1_i1.p1  ORF type:complete len:168 (+),score=24.53 TRINITY_DN3586_c0_g1_i1:67-504(+)